MTANGNPPLHLNLQAFTSYFRPSILVKRSERQGDGSQAKSIHHKLHERKELLRKQ